MRFVHHIPGLIRGKILARINKEHIAARLVFSALLTRAIENENCYGNTGCGEKIGGQPYHSVKEIFLDQRLSDSSFRPAPEQNAMRNDHGHRGRSGVLRSLSCA